MALKIRHRYDAKRWLGFCLDPNVAADTQCHSCIACAIKHAFTWERSGVGMRTIYTCLQILKTHVQTHGCTRFNYDAILLSQSTGLVIPPKLYKGTEGTN